VLSAYNQLGKAARIIRKVYVCTKTSFWAMQSLGIGMLILTHIALRQYQENPSQWQSLPSPTLLKH